MQCKFVVRLIGDDGALLSWAEVYAEPKPQDRGGSCPFWPILPTQFIITQAGTVKQMTVHWCDLNVARIRDMDSIQVQAGQVFNFFWMEPVWMVQGMRDVPLPPVTVGGQITVGIPLGGLAAKSIP